MAAIFEAIDANARASAAAAATRSREGQSGPAAATFAGAVRDLAEALSLLRAPEQSASPGQTESERKHRTTLAQRAREYAERSLQAD
jgi:hypothetical protein